MERQPPVGVTLLCGLVVLASFLSWGSITGKPDLPIVGGMFGDIEFTVILSAWNGSISPGGFALPNWLVVVAAALYAVFTWLRHRRAWTAPRAAFLGLSIYGVGHAGYAVMALNRAEQGAVGLGAILTLVAFVCLLVTAVKEAPAAEPV